MQVITSQTVRTYIAEFNAARSRDFYVPPGRITERRPVIRLHRNEVEEQMMVNI